MEHQRKYVVYAARDTHLRVKCFIVKNAINAYTENKKITFTVTIVKIVQNFNQQEFTCIIVDNAMVYGKNKKGQSKVWKCQKMLR